MKPGPGRLTFSPFPNRTEGSGFLGWWHATAVGRDGKELFINAPDQKMMSVSIDYPRDGRTLEIGKPQALFQTAILDGFSNPQYRKHQYAVSSDGQRFLINSAADTTKLNSCVELARDATEPLDSCITLCITLKLEHGFSGYTST